MANIIQSSLNKIKQYVTGNLPNTVKSYATAYANASQYIPFAPKVSTPQQVQQNYQSFKTNIQPVNLIRNTLSVMPGGQALNNPIVRPNVDKYIQNRYVEPIKALPSNAFETFRPDKPLFTAQRGKAALGTLGGVATLFPDPVQDVAMPVYDFLKGSRAYQLQNQGKKIGAFEAMAKGGIPAMTMEKPVGLGEAVTTQQGAKDILNVAELPLMLAMTHKLTKKPGNFLEEGDIKEIGKIANRASNSWFVNGKVDLKQFSKDESLIDTILKDKYKTPIAELKKIPFQKKIDTLFRIATEDYRQPNIPAGFQARPIGGNEAILKNKVKVTPDGKIKVRGVGEVKAPELNLTMNKTTLRQELTDKVAQIDDLLTGYDLRKKMSPNLMPKSELIKIRREAIQELNGLNPTLRPKIVKTKIPTREEVAATLDDKINFLMESTAGYSTKAPKGGTKGAGFFSKTMRGIDERIMGRIEKGLASENPYIRNASAFLHGFFKELGTSPERQQASFQLKGQLNAANQRPYDIMTELYSALGKDAEASKARIDAVLDPSLAKKKVKFSQLTETEKAVYTLIKQALDLVHDISYANGDISPTLYKKNMGKYTPTLMTPYEIPPEVNNFVTSSFKKIQTDLYRTKGGVTKWKIENKLNDPIYAMGKRLSQVESNRAIKQYTDFIASQPHLVSDVARSGFTKLSDSPAYGSLAGKYILNSAAEELKGHFFANQGLQNLYDVFRWYDRLPPRQLQKKLLTVFNPTTNIGNITTDNVFGFLVGVDPLTLNKNLIQMKNNPSKFKQFSDYLLREGVTGTDITKTDFVSRIGAIDELADTTKKNLLVKGANTIGKKASEFYGGTDDAYKVAALKSLLDQGKTLEEATKLVKDGFQNYSNVGKFYDVASKIPIVGQPFIKFQGDLLRIIKNAAINRPLHLATFLATLKGISYLTSKLSGETDAERTAREDRFGASKIPGLDISLNWQTPYGEINAARYISPFYATNLNESTGSQAASKMLPFVPEIMKDKTGKLDVAGTIAANANDPFVSPLIQAAVDRDFRNKPISDQKASPYFGSDLPQEEQTANKAKFIARGYLPPQVNSLIDIKSAAEGQPDQYGKTRTVPQAIARAAGLKVEQATPDVIKQQESKSAYFEAQGPAFNSLKAQEKAAVLSIPKQDPDDTRDKIYKYTTLLQYPAVYNYLKDIEIGKNQGNTSKVDPLYLYPYSDVRKYMIYQSLGGSDFNSPDAKALYKAEPVIGEISKARSAFYKANPIEGGTQSSRPIPSAYAQQQMDLGNWNDPEVQNYLNANTAWKNYQREKAGLPPLETVGGGFSKFQFKAKPKKVGKISVKKGKTPSKMKIKMPKLTKLKAVKSKKYKAVKLKALKAPKVKFPKFGV